MEVDDGLCANATTAMMANRARTKTVRIMMFLRKLCLVVSWLSG
jgi:predicted nucleic acid-binding Zn ribbon protein